MIGQIIDTLLAEVQAHEAPLERARAATRYLALLQHVQRQVALQRLQDVAQVRAESTISIRALALELGVTKNAISQVVAERRGRSRRRRPPAPPT